MRSLAAGGARPARVGQLRIADLLDINLRLQVAAALESHLLPPSALVIEVTESSVLSDPIRIHDVLERLDELGVGISLDDFGTGFSSLGHLKSLPVAEIKIDGSFVNRMTSDAADARSSTRRSSSLHRLGKRVVAEGVEDERTWQQLAAAGCHIIQGYALSRPSAPDLLEPLLDRHAVRQLSARQPAGANAA